MIFYGTTEVPWAHASDDEEFHVCMNCKEQHGLESFERDWHTIHFEELRDELLFLRTKQRHVNGICEVFLV